MWKGLGPPNTPVSFGSEGIIHGHTARAPEEILWRAHTPIAPGQLVHLMACERVSRWRLGSVRRLWLEVSQSPSPAAQVDTPNRLPCGPCTLLSSRALNPGARRHCANPNPAHPAFCGHHDRGAGLRPLPCFSRGAQGSMTCSPRGTVNDQTGNLFPVSLLVCIWLHHPSPKVIWLKWGWTKRQFKSYPWLQLSGGCWQSITT